jgi:uncharacterized repeat protein (TIGR01451 family)
MIEKEKTMKRTVIVIAFALLLLPAAARAQQGSIQLKSVAEVEVTETNAKGVNVVKRVDAAKGKVVPGDVVIFTTMYTNIGKQPADKVMVTNPVPEHMNYLDKSAEGKGTKIDFSVDKAKTYGTPDKLMVTDAQGKTRKAGPADYTTIRWIVVKPVPPGGTGSVSFRAKLQ